MARRVPALAQLLALIVAALPGVARADGAVSCGRAFEDSQVKRDDGKLLEARDLLRVCAGPTCSRTVQRHCSEWLRDVDARVPSVVLSAKDAAGDDVVQVRVTMDGAEVGKRLDGRAFDVDPGPHTFVFTLADGSSSTVESLVAEREKGKVIAARFAPRPTPTAPETPTVPLREPAPAASGWSGWKTAGLVTGIVGLGGLGAGAAFGLEALATKSDHCGANGLCSGGAASTAYSQGTVSTVGFVAGAALLAGGVAMFVLAPKPIDEHARASVALAPVLGPSSAGLRIGGVW
jgi:hypothetical protein